MQGGINKIQDKLYSHLFGVASNFTVALISASATSAPLFETKCPLLRHCINPDCAAPLRSFSEGRLYQFEIVSISIAANDSANSPFDERPMRRAVHYWLCGSCSARLYLELEPVHGLQVLPLVPRAEGPASLDDSLADEEFGQASRC
jgi:hypothetical protein